jgi:transcriptional regulator with XRE-family HTH domain
MPYGSYHDISARIREVRGELKKAKFADLLGIPRPNFYKYEDGRLPPADVLQRIADYGGVSVKWLLTGEEEVKELGKSSLPDQPPVTPEHPRPCDIQEFLLAEVLRAVEEYMEKHETSHPLNIMARLITAVYNHCARELVPPSEDLIMGYLVSIYDSGPH